jgi:hypothetical protein
MRPLALSGTTTAFLEKDMGLFTKKEKECIGVIRTFA